MKTQNHAPKRAKSHQCTAGLICQDALLLYQPGIEVSDVYDTVRSTGSAAPKQSGLFGRMLVLRWL
jgi:hypothetical protein